MLFKLAAFAIMVGFAAANRLALTPRLALAAKPETEPSALAALRRITFIEITLGFAIFLIVGALGTMHPAVHLMQ